MPEKLGFLSAKVDGVDMIIAACPKEDPHKFQGDVSRLEQTRFNFEPQSHSEACINHQFFLGRVNYNDLRYLANLSFTSRNFSDNRIPPIRHLGSPPPHLASLSDKAFARQLVLTV